MRLVLFEIPINASPRRSHHPPRCQEKPALLFVLIGGVVILSPGVILVLTSRVRSVQLRHAKLTALPNALYVSEQSVSIMYTYQVSLHRVRSEGLGGKQVQPRTSNPTCAVSLLQNKESVRRRRPVNKLPCFGPSLSKYFRLPPRCDSQDPPAANIFAWPPV